MQSAADWTLVLDKVQEAIARALADVDRKSEQDQHLVDPADEAEIPQVPARAQLVGWATNSGQSGPVLERAKESVSKADADLGEAEDPLRCWLEASASLTQTAAGWPTIDRAQ
jgi:hypothetical protein